MPERPRARTRATRPEEPPEPDRRALHLLLDKALDRSPELEDSLQRLLRKVVDVGLDPGVQRSLQVLVLAKQAGETVAQIVQRFRPSPKPGERPGGFGR